jgi:hypothetical protein
MAIGLIDEDESVKNTEERERVTIPILNRAKVPKPISLKSSISSHYLLLSMCANIFSTHRTGLSFESSITQARNRCCFAREINSEVSDLSRMNAASVAYPFPMFYPSRA